VRFYAFAVRYARTAKHCSPIVPNATSKREAVQLPLKKQKTGAAKEEDDDKAALPRNGL
jgi:hypothetical protein